MELENINWLLPLLAGILLGMFYFAGLWFTIKQLTHWKNPALAMTLSLFLRLGIVVAGFYWFTDGQWQELLIALLGFVVVRMLMARRLGPGQLKTAVTR